MKNMWIVNFILICLLLMLVLFTYSYINVSKGVIKTNSENITVLDETNDRLVAVGNDIADVLEMHSDRLSDIEEISVILLESHYE